MGERGEPGPAGLRGETGPSGPPGADAVVPPPAMDVHGVVTHRLAVAGAEMLAVSADGNYAVVAGAAVASLVEVGRARLELLATLTLPESSLPEGATAGEFTGVSIHPSGEYALLAVRDNDPNNLSTFEEVPGKVLAVSMPELSVLGEVTVGRGPDSVAIAPSGDFAVVANEDEEDETDLTNPLRRAGSVSVIDLRDGPEALSQVEVPLPADGIPYFSHDPQPETVRVAPDGSFALITLQENNAISRMEIPDPLPKPLNADAFSIVHFDAGVRRGFGLTEGGAGSASCASSGYDLSLREEFISAREPDGVAITPDGRYFVTADEDNLTWLNAQQHEGEYLSPHGSRSISVYDATTGELLGDSGDSIEEAVTAHRLPQRCSSKGPEPEVVSVGEAFGRLLAFVAIERSDAVTIHDITEPSSIRLLDLVVINPSVVAADVSAGAEPEGIEFIPGRNLLVVSNPEGQSVTLIELRSHGVTGEVSPASAGSDEIANVAINEISSNPNPDWIELKNFGSVPASIGGYTLVDGGGGVHTLPNETTIAANGILLVEELEFGLGSADSVSLHAPNGQLLDSYEWTSHVSTVSRCSDAGLLFWPTPGGEELGEPTPGLPNDCVPPSVPGMFDVVINEIRSSGEDFLELYNNGDVEIDLTYWKIRDGGDNEPFVFAEGTVIAAGGHLLIEGDWPGAPTMALAFGLGSSDSAQLYTPYDVLVDSHSWSSHVNTASRCPDGSGAFVSTTEATKGAANACE